MSFSSTGVWLAYIFTIIVVFVVFGYILKWKYPIVAFMAFVIAAIIVFFIPKERNDDNWLYSLGLLATVSSILIVLSFVYFLTTIPTNQSLQVSLKT